MTQWVYFDVDDTLVLWDKNYSWNSSGESEIFIEDPYNPTVKLGLKIHHKHVEDLKAHKDKGDIIVVWSQGGKEWADAVVEALGLRQYVDYTLTKPEIIYDDLPAKEWLPMGVRWRENTKKDI